MLNIAWIILIIILVLCVFWFATLAKIKKLKKENIGISRVLEKSEEKRMHAERIKNKSLLKINDLQKSISVAAHQLKSPLASVRLSLKMLMDKDFGKITKKQRDILEKTYKKNESLIYLVKDLLEGEELDGEGDSENKSFISMEDLVATVADSYKDEMETKKINFVFKKNKLKVQKILVDQEKIRMVVQNLFDNAIKYTPPEGRIEVSLGAKDDQMEFAIKDSGIGIPENQKKKIFLRFSRGSNAIKSAGSGLGLAIAKDIIEKHHGKIWFESKDGPKGASGSTFFFSLPFANK